MKNGFTLVELMIAVGIVAVLAAIAIPSYSAYTRRANRIDATKTMTLDAQALERCYSQNFAYAPCPNAAAGAAPSPNGNYTITITVTPGPPVATYSIKAVPVSATQLGDASCQQFTLDSAGTQGALDGGGANSTQTCWGST